MKQFRTPTPSHVLKDNQARRDGIAPVRALDDGYVAMRIPEKDDHANGIPGYKTLTRLFPDLVSTDEVVRLAAWKNLEAGELGDVYRVTKRSPNQVRKATRHGNLGIIVK